jgi:hypothetical protein
MVEEQVDRRGVAGGDQRSVAVCGRVSASLNEEAHQIGVTVPGGDSDGSQSAVRVPEVDREACCQQLRRVAHEFRDEIEVACLDGRPQIRSYALLDKQRIHLSGLLAMVQVRGCGHVHGPSAALIARVAPFAAAIDKIAHAVDVRLLDRGEQLSDERVIA